MSILGSPEVITKIGSIAKIGLLIGCNWDWLGPILIDWTNPNWLAWSQLIGFGQDWLGASPKSGLELGLMEIAKVMSPHHHQGLTLGQREKRKRNCSFHH
jgi:hypothetical protein